MTTGIHEEQILGKAYDSKLMRRLIKYIFPLKYYVLLAIFLLLLGTLLQLAGPYLIKIGIDQYIEKKNYDGLQLIILLFGATLLGQSVIRFFQMYLMEWIGQKIMYSLRTQIFSHLQRLPLAFFNRNPIGRLVTRVTTDVDTLNELFTGGFVAIFGDMFMLIGIIIVLFKMNAELALVILTVLPLFSIHHIFHQNAIAEQLSADTNPYCQNQRIPAGKHHGDVRGAVIQSNREKFPAI